MPTTWTSAFDLSATVFTCFSPSQLGLSCLSLNRTTRERSFSESPLALCRPKRLDRIERGSAPRGERR
jgi:hypothetical protein